MRKWVRWIWWAMSFRLSKILPKRLQLAKRCMVYALYHERKHLSFKALVLESTPKGLSPRSTVTILTAKEQHTALTCRWTQLAAVHPLQMIKAAQVFQTLILKAAVLVHKQPSNLRRSIHLCSQIISILMQCFERSRGTTMLNCTSWPRQSVWVWVYHWRMLHSKYRWFHLMEIKAKQAKARQSENSNSTKRTSKMHFKHMAR